MNNETIKVNIQTNTLREKREGEKYEREERGAGRRGATRLLRDRKIVKIERERERE